MIGILHSTLTETRSRCVDGRAREGYIHLSKTGGPASPTAQLAAIGTGSEGEVRNPAIGFQPSAVGPKVGLRANIASAGLRLNTEC